MTEAKPFTRKLTVRAVLLANSEKDWVIFGASDNSDGKSYRHLVPEEWEEDIFNQATVVVEFKIEVSTRPIALARLPKMKTHAVAARAKGGHVRVERLSPERRSEIARAAATKRWGAP